MNFRSPLLMLTAVIALVPLALHAQEHRASIALTVKNNGTGTTAGQATLHFGVQPGATDCIDKELGEEKYPPFGPEAVFDARLVDPDGRAEKCLGDGVVLDVRGYRAPNQDDTFKLNIQPGAGGYPLTISWDPAQFRGEVRGLKIFSPLDESNPVDMLQQSSYTIEQNFLKQATIIMSGGGTAGLGGTSSDRTGGDYLRQVSANPVSRREDVAIVYGLSEPSHVSLKLYNVLGREIYSVLDEHQDAGEHRLRLRIDPLAPGNYYYTIVAGTFTATRQLVVLD